MTYKHFLICSQQREEDSLRHGNRIYGHRCVRPALYLLHHSRLSVSNKRCYIDYFEVLNQRRTIGENLVLQVAPVDNYDITLSGNYSRKGSIVSLLM